MSEEWSAATRSTSCHGAGDPAPVGPEPDGCPSITRHRLDKQLRQRQARRRPKTSGQDEGEQDTAESWPPSGPVEPGQLSANRVRDGGVRVVETAYPVARTRFAAGHRRPECHPDLRLSSVRPQGLEP